MAAAPSQSAPIATLFSGASSSFRGSRLRRSQGIAVLQIERAQCVFDGVTEADDSTLQIGAEQSDKGFALPENFRPSHGAGTARVINKILFHQKRGPVVAIQSQIQRV